jgi:hypothetical protein
MNKPPAMNNSLGTAEFIATNVFNLQAVNVKVAGVLRRNAPYFTKNVR